MFIMRQTSVTVAFLLIICTNYESIHGQQHPIYECRFENHRRLQDVQRWHDNTLFNTSSDTNLQSGWYRFDSPQYNRMLEKNDLPKEEFLSASQLTFRPCGIVENPARDFHSNIKNGIPSTFFYALSEPHPQQTYEILTTTAVACQYEHSPPNFIVGGVSKYPGKECKALLRTCFYKLVCGLQDSIEIAVRNCGNFFVYYLQPTKVISLTRLPKGASYCATKKPITSLSEKNTMMYSACYNYVNNSDNTRHWLDSSRNVRLIGKYCQDITFTDEWTRFIYANMNAMVPETCPYENSSNRSLLCGGIYGGWMVGKHPTIPQTRVDRAICFTSSHQCSCTASMKILVLNCGNFYIYKRPAYHPICYSRVCTKPDNKHMMVDNDNNSSMHNATMNTTATTTTISTTTVNTTINITMVSNSTILQNQTLPVNVTTTANSTTTPMINVTSTTVATTTPSLPTVTSMCNDYITITDDSRLFSETNPFALCDFFYERAVRFKSRSGNDVMLKEKCSDADVNGQYRRFCSSDGLSWLTEKHPNVSENVVLRSICVSQNINALQTTFPNPSCTCDKSFLIKVQNCSSFYVYSLPPAIINDIQDCAARYCTQPIDDTRLSTTKTPSASTQSLPSTKPFDLVNFPYQLEGSFQILEPKYNFRDVTMETITQTDSDDYKAILEICINILDEVLADETQVTRKIDRLRFGSLIADFTLSSQQDLNQASLQTKIQQRLQSVQVDQRSGSNIFTGVMNASSAEIRDIDECATSNPCNENAECTNTMTSYTCVCNDGFQGNGIFCIRKPEEDDDDDWSNNSIAAVSVISAILLITLVFAIFLAVVLFMRHKSTVYQPSKHFRQSGYDNYLETDKPNDKPNGKPSDNTEEYKMNMYVAVEPPASTLNSFQPEDEKAANGNPVKK